MSHLPQMTGRISVIPAAILIGIVFAATGGFYVWGEIFPQPQTPAQQEPAITHLSGIVSDTIPPAPTHVIPGTPERAEISDETTQSAASAVTAAGAAGSAVPVAATQRDERANMAGVRAAWQAYQSGDLDRAEERYRGVLREDSHNRDALLGMAAIAQQHSRNADARAYYRQILDLDPDDPLGYAALSNLSADENAADVESRLRLLLAQHPQAAALYLALGNHYAELSRWRPAQQAYLRAAELEPDNAQVAFNLAVSFEHLGQRSFAVQHYRRALQPGVSGADTVDRALIQQRVDTLRAY